LKYVLRKYWHPLIISFVVAVTLTLIVVLVLSTLITFLYRYVDGIWILRIFGLIRTYQYFNCLLQVFFWMFGVWTDKNKSIHWFLFWLCMDFSGMSSNIFWFSVREVIFSSMNSYYTSIYGYLYDATWICWYEVLSGMLPCGIF
jgi:hypothetical protein